MNSSVVLILARRDFLKKGARVVIKVATEYYLSTITMLRQGRVYLHTDDGDKISFSESSKNIIGEAKGKRTRKTPIPPNSLNDYLVNPVTEKSPETTPTPQTQVTKLRKTNRLSTKPIVSPPTGKQVEEYNKKKDKPTDDPISDIIHNRNNRSKNIQALESPIFRIIYNYRYPLSMIVDKGIVDSKGFVYNSLNLTITDGYNLEKALAPYVKKTVKGELGAETIFFKDGSMMFASPINSLYKNSRQINYVSAKDYRNRVSSREKKKSDLKVKPIVINVADILKSVSDNTFNSSGIISLWSESKKKWIELKSSVNVEVNNMSKALELIKPYVDHVISLTPRHAKMKDGGYTRYFALKNGGIIQAYPINKQSGWMFYITPTDARRFFQ